MAKKPYGKRGKPSLPPFLRVERDLFNSEVWRGLSYPAVRVYLCFRYAENGANKDDLRVSYRYIQRHGVKSSDTISRSIRELEQAGLIRILRHGGLYKRSNVYGLSDGWKIREATRPAEASSFAPRREEVAGKNDATPAAEAVGDNPANR